MDNYTNVQIFIPLFYDLAQKSPAKPYIFGFAGLFVAISFLFSVAEYAEKIEKEVDKVEIEFK